MRPVRPPPLNPAQLAAVEYCDGPLLVIAGAGSGKTRVLTEKLAYLAERRQRPPEKIAAVTFTNKAAREMRTRLAARLGPAAHGFAISTFHALGWRLVRHDPAACGRRSGMSLFDEADTLTLITEIAPARSSRDELAAIRSRLSRWKNDGLDPETAAGRAVDNGEARAARVYRAYETQLQRLNAVDFDDLILAPLTALEAGRAPERWRLLWHDLLVDEYQDTNLAQYRLLSHLAGPRARLTVVGDDDQSIYGWRGAAPDNLERLVRDFPELRVIKLEQNYRSTGRILSLANGLIAHNPHLYDKRLWSALGEGEKPRLIPCDDAEAEAERVCGEVQRRIMSGGVKAGECAVLYRSHHLSRPFEKALRQLGVRYHLSGGASWFERREIRDLLAYLRLLVNPEDNTAFLRVINVPRRGLGERFLSLLAAEADARSLSFYAAASDPAFQQQLGAGQAKAVGEFLKALDETAVRAAGGGAAAALDELLAAIGYRAWLQDQADEPAQAERQSQALDELLAWLARLEKEDAGAGVADLLARILLLGNLDDENDAGDAVRLMTLHAAKGLEFDEVYLVGLEDGLLPHRNSLDEGNEAEERRLFYVGITRARRRLTMTYGRARSRHGQRHDAEPSRFLGELPIDHLEWYGRDPEADRARRARAAREGLATLRAMLDPAMPAADQVPPSS